MDLLSCKPIFRLHRYWDINVKIVIIGWFVG